MSSELTELNNQKRVKVGNNEENQDPVDNEFYDESAPLDPSESDQFEYGVPHELRKSEKQKEEITIDIADVKTNLKKIKHYSEYSYPIIWVFLLFISYGFYKGSKSNCNSDLLDCLNKRRLHSGPYITKAFFSALSLIGVLIMAYNTSKPKIKYPGIAIVAFIYIKVNWTVYGFLQDQTLGTKQLFNYSFGLLMAIFVYGIVCS